MAGGGGRRLGARGGRRRGHVGGGHRRPLRGADPPLRPETRRHRDRQPGCAARHLRVPGAHVGAVRPVDLGGGVLRRVGGRRRCLLRFDPRRDVLRHRRRRSRLLRVRTDRRHLGSDALGGTVDGAVRGDRPRHPVALRGGTVDRRPVVPRVGLRGGRRLGSVLGDGDRDRRRRSPGDRPHPPDGAGFPPHPRHHPGVPLVAEAAGWRWAFAGLAVGPALGVVAMVRLRRSPFAASLVGGRG